MSKKFLLTILLVALALIFSLISLFLTWGKENEFKKKISDLEAYHRKIDKEISLFSQKVSPYIYTGVSVGYVINFENGVKFYFAGDSGLSADMEIIGDYYQPDVAFLPIGNIYTMDPKSAAYAAKLINPSSYVIPTNYASFPELTQEPTGFLNELEKYKIKAKPLVFKPGESQTVMGIKVEWLGHNSWSFETPKGSRVLIDPSVQYNPSFPKKYTQLIPLEKVDLILITNGHFDHISFSDIRKWGELFDPIFITPYELGIWLKGKFPSYKIVAANGGAKISKTEFERVGISREKLKEIGELIIDIVPASNSSSIIPEALY